MNIKLKVILQGEHNTYNLIADFYFTRTTNTTKTLSPTNTVSYTGNKTETLLHIDLESPHHNPHFLTINSAIALRQTGFVGKAVPFVQLKFRVVLQRGIVVEQMGRSARSKPPLYLPVINANDAVYYFPEPNPFTLALVVDNRLP